MGLTPHKPKRRSRRRGFTLLIVLILVLMIAVLVYGLQRDVVREVAISANVRDDLRASFLAEMALIRAQVILRIDEYAEYDSLNENWSKPLTWQGETWGNEDSGAGGEQPPEPTVLIVDEDRKFNLLTLVRGTEDQQKAAADVFKRLIEICRREDKRLQGNLEGNVRSVRRGDDETATTETLVTNLIRYLKERVTEESDELEFSAAGTGDVRGMKKQTPWEMLTLGELLQIEGWTTQLLYGPVRKQDTALDSRGGEDEEEQPRSWNELTDEEKFDQTRSAVENADQRSLDPNPIGLIHYLTLYSGGQININTAPRELILALDKDLTWEVVDQIITAREQDRVDVRNEEETGEIPEYNTPAPSTEGDGEGSSAEDEDKASFRAADVASYAAFVKRVTNQQSENGEGAAEIQDFSEEIFNRFRIWLTVRSTVYAVEASAKVGKVTHTIKAIYRRSGTSQAQNNTSNTNGNNTGNNTGNNAGNTANPATNGSQANREQVTTENGTPLPPEPTMKLTLLFRDVVIK